MTSTTHMRREIDEVPAVVDRLLTNEAQTLDAAAGALSALDPSVLVTIARGSSDHASSYLKYAFELSAHRPVASIGPSIASVYGVDLALAGSAALAVSQSGKSPDLIAMLESARRGGALTLALTNAADSPLAGAADHAIDICAGPEHAVAATKTVVASIVAGLIILARWQNDPALSQALANLPETLNTANRCDWSALGATLEPAHSVYVLGRGPSASIAGEAALKFKETSGLHAEAYSTAEVLHGPSAIVTDGFPALVLTAEDKARQSVLESAQKLADQGGTIFVTEETVPGCTSLPVARTGHPLTDPLAALVSFYGFVEQFSRARGRNPDAPDNLNKVTSTR